jgi:16S rRNA (guanine966-N2)-methyltransferase
MNGSVRIIGGHWRGSKLPVADLPGLRPSADRVRETLFNWLQSRVPGANCLDLFAGSGALGLEAASRGAARVVLVEREHAQVATLRANVARLEGAPDKVEIIEADALDWLAQPPSRAFDLVFLDPPFAARLWDPILAALPGWLSPGAWIYLESPVAKPPAVPGGWVLHREGCTREVRYALYRSGTATPVTLHDSLDHGSVA